jgi:creatinine amidohydrolase
MRVRDLNWMQLEEYLQRDDRIVLPVGSTEQHAYLSLETDNVIAERLAGEAAEPLGIPVLPVLAYGIAPGFSAYPGTATLRIETFIAVVHEILESLYGQGFRRFAIVNGHGGNSSAREAVMGWMDEHTDAVLLWHEAWDGKPDEIAAQIDPDYDHASWSENFPWTRLAGVELPQERKPPYTRPKWSRPKEWREALGDGSFGGPYELPEEDVLLVWNAAVDQLRERLASGWP